MLPAQREQIEQMLKYGHDYIVFPESAKEKQLPFDILKNDDGWYSLNELETIFGERFRSIPIVREPFHVAKWSFDRDSGYSEAQVIAVLESFGYVNIKTPEMKISEVDWENAPDNGFGLFSELEIQYVKAHT